MTDRNSASLISPVIDPSLSDGRPTSSYFAAITIPAHDDTKGRADHARKHLLTSVKHNFVMASQGSKEHILLAAGCPRAMMLAFSAGLRILSKKNASHTKTFSLPANSVHPETFTKIVDWFKRICNFKNAVIYPTMSITPDNFVEAFQMFKTFTFLKIPTGAERLGTVCRDYMDTFPLNVDEFALVERGMGNYSAMMCHMLEATVQFWFVGVDEHEKDIKRWISKNHPKMHYRMKQILSEIDPELKAAKEFERAKKSANLAEARRQREVHEQRSGQRSGGDANAQINTNRNGYGIESSVGTSKGKKSSPRKRRSTNAKPEEQLQGDLQAARNGFRALDESDVEYLLTRY